MLVGQSTAVVALSPLAPAEPALAWMLRGQFLVGLLGLGLAAAAFFRALRLPVIASAAVSKLAFLVLALSAPQTGSMTLEVLADLTALSLLAAAAWMFFQATRQEARWEGMLPLRPEA
ncbi:MAG: hypothetical protein EON92_04785 [Burkholderiales bacterium]|nr:MAG: hypothetical protein EON92_04785 [Burkholderiales bacterium]